MAIQENKAALKPKLKQGKLQNMTEIALVIHQHTISILIAQFQTSRMSSSQAQCDEQSELSFDRT